MFMLKKSALTEENGKIFYKGDLFSGVSFTMSEGELVNAIEVSDGMEVGKYFPKYFPESDYRVIDIDLLDPENEDDYEPFLCLNGERFSGIALEFDGAFCTGELLFVRGWSDSKVSYYKTGRVESIELIENGFSQIFHCYENYKLKKYEISVRNSFSFKLAFDEDGALSVLGVEGDYFNQVKLISNKLAIPVIKNDTFLDDLKAAHFLCLSGAAITDKLFKRLISSGVLELTENISLFQTSVTEESLYLLQNDNRLNELHVNSNIIKLDEVKSFKSNKPDCYVKYNCEEVVA